MTREEGLDVFKLDRNGRASTEPLTLSAAFASPSVTAVVDSGRFPQLREMWDYKSTIVPPDDIALVHDQVSAVMSELPAVVTSEARSELKELRDLLAEALAAGVGILAEDP